MNETTTNPESLNALPVNIAILDTSGTIVAVNDAWKDFGQRNELHLENYGIGAKYIQYCKMDNEDSSQFVMELKQLLAQRRDLLTLIYPCHSAIKRRWFSLLGIPLSSNGHSGVALLHVNFTDMLMISNSGNLKRIADKKKSERLVFDVSAISGAVERSASNSLSAQLNSMLTGSQDTAQPGIPRSSDRKKRVVARTQLSKRQLEVLQLIGKGKTNKEIANELLRSPNTIKLHVSAILRQLNLRSRTEAALLASNLGL